MAPSEVTAVVLMAYGSPRSVAEIGPYYTDIRGGRPPTPELLADLVARYDAIGGLSPLAAHTEDQRARLQAALDERRPGRFEVVLGYRHVSPRVEDAVAALGARGVRSAVGLVLAPHWSALSVGQYHERARTAAAGVGVAYHAIERWHLEPAYVSFHAEAVRRGLTALPEDSKVVFTAHSLPARIVAAGDPYPDLLRETAAAIAAETGLPRWGAWCVGYQSAGRTPEPWLQPDVGTIIDELAASEGGTGLLVCACGFVADHLELLYDLDIEAARRAAAVGLAFARTPAVNDDPAVMAGLADLVTRAVPG
jgi:ferrochelatase